jgi:4-aminobutyrate aminotransferase-like enzyme
VEGLRRICDEHGIVLVADEVQTSFGRTGKMFAMEHFAVEPDLMIVAKSIAGGLPLSGVIGRAEIMDDPHSGAIGGTFIGNPVALAAALAVLDVFQEEQLVGRPAARRPDPRADAGWQRRHPQIGDVRGLGAMLALSSCVIPRRASPRRSSPRP